ncbi:type-2 ice-structuring protein-like isoform X1 [Eriocheir sinensis]|uniref:type-2 ice-structuring protein-like isoform X1 n=1 Tax=Eriocheir sinensis TaxID=95602 RepID=UPI0021C6921F|nr:type-2 ice-structuring protein-like isoform X1 [Eriocheir sinensis]
MMSAAAKFVLPSLALLGFVCTGAMAYPQSQPTRDVEELRSALAMSQMILAQQAQLFRELINATKESHRCCNAGKSDLTESTLDCPAPFQRVVDECFFMSTNSLTWENARHSCVGMGADLTTPTYLYSLRSFIRQGRKGSRIRSVWVGGKDNGPEGWRWLNGLPVNDAEWGKKQPDAKRAASRCLALRPGSHPLLYDEPCRSTLRYVCQYNGELK